MVKNKKLHAACSNKVTKDSLAKKHNRKQVRSAAVYVQKK